MSWIEWAVVAALFAIQLWLVGSSLSRIEDKLDKLAEAIYRRS